MNKAQVIDRWAQGKTGATSNGSLTAASNGFLWSYGLVIGMSTADGLIVGNFTASDNGEFYSMTTSHHVGDAARVARKVSVGTLLRAHHYALQEALPSPYEN